ncbi:hypothetical protein [Streptomyces roseolus]
MALRPGNCCRYVRGSGRIPSSGLLDVTIKAFAHLPTCDTARA